MLVQWRVTSGVYSTAGFCGHGYVPQGFGHSVENIGSEKGRILAFPVTRVLRARVARATAADDNVLRLLCLGIHSVALDTRFRKCSPSTVTLMKRRPAVGAATMVESIRGMD